MDRKRLARRVVALRRQQKRPGSSLEHLRISRRIARAVDLTQRVIRLLVIAHEVTAHAGRRDRKLRHLLNALFPGAGRLADGRARVVVVGATRAVGDTSGAASAAAAMPATAARAGVAAAHTFGAQTNQRRPAGCSRGRGCMNTEAGRVVARVNGARVGVVARRRSRRRAGSSEAHVAKRALALVVAPSAIDRLAVRALAILGIADVGRTALVVVAVGLGAGHTNAVFAAVTDRTPVTI